MLDEIRNERIRRTIKVTVIPKNAQERKLQWYGNVMRRNEEYVGRRVMDMKVQGRRNGDRPKRRWMNRVRETLIEKGMTGREFHGRPT